MAEVRDRDRPAALKLDHTRSVVREQTPAIWAGHVVAQVEDAQAFERGGIRGAGRRETSRLSRPNQTR